MSTGDPREIVAAKRDGRALTASELIGFVQAYAEGGVSDPLAAAFLMACVLNGLDDAELEAMTHALVSSGETVAFPSLSRASVDKHSTGGVSDGVTLVFAPLVAALGLAVAKLSGRGLGHTGGTLDKLESIPGLRTDLDPERFERQVVEVGCAVAAQSPRLVPADGALYALREATATVPSIPLIAASVMSKKLAVQTDLILLDVKLGSGAFMKTPDEARSLAERCRALAGRWGRACGVAVTDMSQPLGEAVGNALEVRETVQVLRGERRGRVRDLAMYFAARALEHLEPCRFEEGLRMAETSLDDGSALERFAAMVSAQGGDARVADDPDTVLPRAPVVRVLTAERDGWLAAIETEEIGSTAVDLGAGRRRKSDAIDPSVGIVVRTKIGDRVRSGQPIGEVHARTETDADRAAERIAEAMRWADGEVPTPALVHAWI